MSDRQTPEDGAANKTLVPRPNFTKIPSQEQYAMAHSRLAALQEAAWADGYRAAHEQVLERVYAEIDRACRELLVPDSDTWRSVRKIAFQAIGDVGRDRDLKRISRDGERS